MKKRELLTSANVPTGSPTRRWQRKLTAKRLLNGLQAADADYKRLRRLEFRYRNAPTAAQVLVLMALAFTGGWLVGVYSDPNAPLVHWLTR